MIEKKRVFRLNLPLPPVTMMSVTANGVVLDSTLTLRHLKTTNTSVESCVNVVAIDFVSSANIEFMETGYYLSGSFSIHGTTTYIGALGNNHRHMIIRKISAPSQVEGVVYDFPSEATPRSSFIYVNAASVTDYFDDLLYVANTSQLNPARIQRQFYLQDTFVRQTSKRHKLWFANNTWDDLNGGIGILGAINAQVLNNYAYIALFNNTQGNGGIASYKGMFYIDGSGTLHNIGNTVWYYGGNVHPTALRVDYSSSFDNGGIAYRNTIYNAYTAVLATEQQTYDLALAYDVADNQTFSVGDLTDVDITTTAPLNSYGLVYNSTTQKWEGKPIVRTVNTVAPDINGNVAAAFTKVTTGTLAARPAVGTPGLQEAELYIVSADTAANNGRTFIYDADSIPPAWREINNTGGAGVSLFKVCSPFGSNVTGSGTFNSPYQTIAHAITEAGDTGVVICLPGTYNEVITMASQLNIVIMGLSSAIGSHGVNLNGGFILSGTTTRVRIRDISIIGTVANPIPLVDNSSQGRNYYYNVYFGGNAGTAVQFATPNRWHEFTDCSFAGDFNTGSVTGINTAVIRLFRPQNLLSLTISNNLPGGVIVSDADVLGLTLHLGSPLLLSNVRSVVSFNCDCDTPNGFLYMDNVSFYVAATNTYTTLLKTGTCGYRITNTLIDRANPILTGFEIDTTNTHNFMKLKEVEDVNLITTPPVDKQVLMYDQPTSTWVPGNASGAFSGTLAARPASYSSNTLYIVDGDATAENNGRTFLYDVVAATWIELDTKITNRKLDDLTDVDLTTVPPADKDILIYDLANAVWKPVLNTAVGYTYAPISPAFATITQGHIWIESTTMNQYIYVIDDTPSSVWVSLGSISAIDNSIANHKNRIINGDMRISQKYNGSSFTMASTVADYAVDKFVNYTNMANQFSIGRNLGSVTTPNEFKNYLGVQSLLATALSATSVGIIEQTIEGFDCSDFMFGTMDARNITLSFWVRSSVVGNHALGLRNAAYDRCYVAEYAITTANTWQKISITIPGDTTGTWAIDNTVGLGIQWNLGSGTNFITPTLNAWQAGGFISGTGSFQTATVNGAWYLISGVQFEIGRRATPFEYVEYTDMLARCQRYFYTAVRGVGSLGTGFVRNLGDLGYVGIKHPVSMRTNPIPTMSAASSLGSIRITDHNSFDSNVTGLNSYRGNTDITTLYFSCSIGGGSLRPVHVYTEAAGLVQFNAEF